MLVSIHSGRMCFSWMLQFEVFFRSFNIRLTFLLISLNYHYYQEVRHEEIFDSRIMAKWIPKLFYFFIYSFGFGTLSSRSSLEHPQY